MRPKEQSVRIGTRGSRLALIQAHSVQSALTARCPGLGTEIMTIKSEGEKKPSTDLREISGDGIFTKELDLALIARRIDLAVHSMKDLPTSMHEGVELAAVTGREEPGEAFVSDSYDKLDELPKGARVGTGSPRRKAQLLFARPDLEIVSMRGNVETRLDKMGRGQADALILACAGLHRLGLEARIRERLPIDAFVPPPGQGTIGITVRSGDGKTASLASLVNDIETAAATAAERAFLVRLGGGCKTPIACHAVSKEGRLDVIGFVASPDGTAVIKESASGPAENGADIGVALAQKLLSLGAGAILAENEHGG